jgi:uncharacterized protein (DUF302 family)
MPAQRPGIDVHRPIPKSPDNNHQQQSMGNASRLLSALTLLVAVTAGYIRISWSGDDNIVTVKVEGEFADIAANVRSAIIGKGINISNTLPASDMLHRTGADFGYKDDVYADAETYEFCSAELSHKLARKHPDNIVLCPFTISVYVVNDEPGFVRLSYRIPSGKPGTEAIADEVVDLIKSIIDDATW